MPKITLRVADSETSREFNLDEVTTSVTWETSLEEQPGKMTFEIEDTSKEMFFEGSNVVLAVDGQKVFDGYVFNRKRSEGPTMQVIVYDRLRYFQNKDTYAFENQSVEEIFETICKKHELPYRKQTFDNYKTAPIVHDNKSLYSMLQRAIDETLINKGRYLMLRDNLGTLELADIADLRTNVLVGDGSALTNFTFESTIDTETYNYVKLVQENKNTKTRDVYIAKDSSTIYKWGRLQHYETVSESLTKEQIIERANQLLNLYNRRTRTLSVKGVGDVNIRAGNGIALYISKLASEGIAQLQYAYVTKASHTIANNAITMDLALEVV